MAVEDNKHRNLAKLTNLAWLKAKFFSDPAQTIHLKEGESLMSQGEDNQRIYLIRKGKLTGYYKPESGERFEIFNSGKNMIVGIYSFFSEEGKSYTTVVARQPSEVVYVEKAQIPYEGDDDYTPYLKNMLPVVANEIYLRQMMVVRSTTDKNRAMKKLFQSEKMATLGQLAAGLAHELNNAIGVIHSKSLFLTERLKEAYDDGDSNGVYQFFLKGLESGQTMSSSDIRKRKKKISKKIDIKDSMAKKLARISLTEEEINFIAMRRNEAFIRKVDYYWETGLALHDMQIAANHTTHVVKSIKDLGAKSHVDMVDCDLRLTLKKSLTLLSNLVKRVKINVNVEKGLVMTAREGDLIQVWVNLIKNAIESVLNADIDKPEITLESEVTKRHYKIKIIDNGPGIPKNLQSSIFQPNVTTKVHGLSFGLGLGLSIVQKIVASYSGSIFVESEPGHTEFKVQFAK
ncbi:MAG: cyclic nucleotide-binding domain-containing protein [Cyclobacteriaceae bacterium]